jgi:hypothetical protein
VAGLSRDEFEAVGKEILAAWDRAQTRDEGCGSSSTSVESMASRM